MQWSAGGASDPLRIRFLAGDEAPAQVAAECSGRADLTGLERTARAQAMTDMFRYSGFRGGVWRWRRAGLLVRPDSFYNRHRADHSIRPQGRIFPSYPAIASRRLFWRSQQTGMNAASRNCAINSNDMACTSFRPRSALSAPLFALQTPQTVYEQLLATYRADLSAAVPPQSGGPVEILITER